MERLTKRNRYIRTFRNAILKWKPLMLEVQSSMVAAVNLNLMEEPFVIYVTISHFSLNIRTNHTQE